MPRYWPRSSIQAPRDQVEPYQQQGMSTVSPGHLTHTRLNTPTNKRPTTSAAEVSPEKRTDQDQRVSHNGHGSDSRSLTPAGILISSKTIPAEAAVASSSLPGPWPDVDMSADNSRSTMRHDGQEVHKTDPVLDREWNWRKIRKLFKRSQRSDPTANPVSTIRTSGSVRQINAFAPQTISRRGTTPAIVAIEQSSPSVLRKASLKRPESARPQEMLDPTESGRDRARASIVDIPSTPVKPRPEIATPTMQRRATSPCPSSVSQSSARYMLFPKSPPIPRQRSVTVSALTSGGKDSVALAVDKKDMLSKSGRSHSSPQLRDERTATDDGVRSTDIDTVRTGASKVDNQSLRQTKSVQEFQLPVVELSQDTFNTGNTPKVKWTPPKIPRRADKHSPRKVERSSSMDRTTAIVEKLAFTLSAISESTSRNQQMPTAVRGETRTPHTIPSVQVRRRNSSLPYKEKETQAVSAEDVASAAHAQQPPPGSSSVADLRSRSNKPSSSNQRGIDVDNQASPAVSLQEVDRPRYIVPLSRYAPAHTSADLSSRTGLLPIHHQRSNTEPIRRAPSSRALFLESLSLPVQSKPAVSFAAVTPPAPVSKSEPGDEPPLSLARKISVSRKPSVTKVEIKSPRLGGKHATTDAHKSEQAQAQEDKQKQRQEHNQQTPSSSSESLATEPITPGPSDSTLNRHTRALPPTPTPTIPSIHSAILGAGQILPRKPTLQNVSGKHKPGNSTHLLNLIDVVDSEGSNNNEIEDRARHGPFLTSTPLSIQDT